jgi:RNA polymerase sigma factor (sigma-70 family)
MATRRVNGMIGHFRRAVFLRDGAGLTDGQLLECYVARRDEDALEALVRRHGPMVLGVCRRVLGHHHDAEDAFQATFLVLVRKASTVRPREQVGNWLYGVACQTARKARAAAARRRARERQVPDMPESEAPPDPANDLPALLDQELSGLPDRYRVPIVMCDLEGKTRKEAALQLGWPEGTVHGRLARGRALLARRLAARGVVVAGGSLAAALAPGLTSAAMPATLVTSTIQTATLFAAGQAAAGVASVNAAALAEGVIKAMLVTKLKIATAVVVVLGVVGLGDGFGPYSAALAADGGGAGQQEKQLREKVTELEKQLQREREEKEKLLAEKERLEKIERLERDLRQERERNQKLIYDRALTQVQMELKALDAEERIQELTRRLEKEQAARKALEDQLQRLKNRQLPDLRIAAQWHSLLEKEYQAARDAEFARRLYLDLTGTVPSAEEVRRFVEDKDAKKHEKLIDKLLDDRENAKAVRDNLRKWLHDYYGREFEQKKSEDGGPAKPKP